MGSQTCEPVSAKSCSWVTYVAAWGLSRDCTFLFEDGKRLSHNPLNVLLLCVGKTEISCDPSLSRGRNCTSVCVVCVLSAGRAGRKEGLADGRRVAVKTKPHTVMLGTKYYQYVFIAITIGITVAILVQLPLPFCYHYHYQYYYYCATTGTVTSTMLTAMAAFPVCAVFELFALFRAFRIVFCFSCQFLCVVRMFLFLSIFPFFTSVHLGCAPLS